MARRVFYSFHYKPDVWRTAQVRGIGAIDGNKPATDNDWETVKKGGEAAIKRWIANQMKNRSCTVVLVGSGTARRKWINHEIVKSWGDGMGVVGIHIHGLKDSAGRLSVKGENPFASVKHVKTGKQLSSIVKCYTPAGGDSQQRYQWIEQHLANAIDAAIDIRKKN